MHDDFTRLAAEYQRAGDLPTGVPAAAIARTLVAIMAGYILQLTILGPDAAAEIRDVVRALWPSPLPQPPVRPGPGPR
jgi:TetR/AcrR family transcriptional regulator, transcriptional repressor of aconitase